MTRIVDKDTQKGAIRVAVIRGMAIRDKAIQGTAILATTLQARALGLRMAGRQQRCHTVTKGVVVGSTGNNRADLTGRRRMLRAVAPPGNLGKYPVEMITLPALDRLTRPRPRRLSRR